MYIALGGTSNARQLDPHGFKQGRPYHTSGHRCCILGGNTGIRQAFSYINSISEVKVASYPGLSMDNWESKKCPCPAGDFYNLTLLDFVSRVCADPNFSGTLALLLLCNDEAFFYKMERAEEAVLQYFAKLQAYLGRAEGTVNLKHLILNTVLFRQSDFKKGSEALRSKKSRFNRALVLNQSSPEYHIMINHRMIPYTVVDMNSFLPEALMDRSEYYCKDEVYNSAGRLKCIHIRAPYMEQYLRSVQNVQDQLSVSAVPSNTSPKKKRKVRNRKQKDSTKNACEILSMILD